MIHDDTLGIYHVQVMILFMVVLVVSIYLPIEAAKILCALSLIAMLSVAMFAVIRRARRTTCLLLVFHVSFAVALAATLIFAYRVAGAMPAVAVAVTLSAVRLGIGYAYWRPQKKLPRP